MTTQPTDSTQYRKDQAIRLATGERITADILSIDEDGYGTSRHGDHEITLQPHDCDTGTQWIERAIPDRLIQWAEKYYDCEVGIMSLEWDIDNQRWEADLYFDAGDAGVVFTLDAEHHLHIQQQFPHTIVIHF